PLDERADLAMNAAWHSLVAGRAEGPVEIERRGRSVHVPHAAGRMARFTFADLCERPLGASDYLEIAKRFDTIFVEHVPLLGPEKRNETKRFIILIDALYDHSVRLFVSAAAAPEELLVVRKGTEGFEFDRTISRLFEMRSADYLALHKRQRSEM
ncbi:MAG TPA: AFG1/ZapE family ATPase, partial [Rhizobium sp.]|nr:AFG1/ZapE family ATPase [Rhizobium sp.]